MAFAAQLCGAANRACSRLSCASSVSYIRALKIPLLLLIALGLASQFASRAEEPLEYQVKAAFLLNFTKFTEWPPQTFSSPDTPVSICVLGENPFGNALSQIVEGEVVGGRKVVLENVGRPPLPQSCRALFYNGPAKEFRSLSVGTGVLTVGEGESFLHEGGMIGFVIENHRVRFVINQAAAEKAGLRLSSKLLSVAKSVDK